MDWKAAGLDFTDEEKEAMQNDLYSGGWCLLPRKLLLNKNISQGCKILYCLISNLCAEKGYCWAKNEYLAEQLDVSTATISRWLEEIEMYLIVKNGSNQQRIIIVTASSNMIRQKNSLIKYDKAASSNLRNPIYMNKENRITTVLDSHENIKSPNEKKSPKPLAPVAAKTLPERIKGLTDFIKNIDKELLSAWELAYSHINITEHMAKAVAWALSNPKDAPKSDYKRFLNAWLARDESKEVNRKARDHQFGGDDPDRFNFKQK